MHGFRWNSREMKQFIVALLTLAVCGVTTAQPTFSFTENDYRGLESAGVLRATVRRSGSQTGVIVVNVRTMTKLQYLALGFSLAGFPSLDPAELGDPIWNDDFALIDVNMTFTNAVDRITVDIPITDDNVDEVEEEGFIIVMDVVEASENFIVTRNVTVGLIQDDDDLIMTFEIPSLTVSEAQGSLEVFVTKQNGTLSERIVDVNVDAFSHNATYDLDFTLPEGRPQTLVFSPTDTRLSIGAIIIDDARVEGLEHFSADLIVSPNNDYVLGKHPRILVFITDNDEAPTTIPTSSVTSPLPNATTPTSLPTGSMEDEEEDDDSSSSGKSSSKDSSSSSSSSSDQTEDYQSKGKSKSSKSHRHSTETSERTSTRRTSGRTSTRRTSGRTSTRRTSGRTSTRRTSTSGRTSTRRTSATRTSTRRTSTRTPASRGRTHKKST